MKKNIGIIGGTFNPIHNGHLMIAENAYHDFNLDEVWFIPAFKPPHKQNQHILDDELRLEMVRLAVEDVDYFKVSDIEIKAQKTSYTYETLMTLQERYPDASFSFIMGADSLLQFDGWKNPRIILAYARLLVAARDDLDTKDLEVVAHKVMNTYGGKVDILSVPELDISSTMLRKRASEGKSLRYFLPDCVNTYIQKHGIYKGVS